MLQFSSNDTVKWHERFGNKQDGDTTPSGTFGNAKTTFTGTQDTSTGVVGSASGFSTGDLVMIHQSRDGGDGAGVWQLNKITNIVGTTFTFKYPLQNDFATTAQIIKINQNKNITLSSTVTVPAWDGSVGGIAIFMGKSITITSAPNAAGANGVTSSGARPSGGGYRGGKENNNQHTFGFRGEGTASAGNDQSSSANGNGSGAPSETGHGGGGANGAAGTNGENGSVGGAIAGNEELTVMTFGGAGSSGVGGDNSNAGSGANGGGIIVLIAEEITFTGVGANLNGGTGVEGDTGGGRKYGGDGAGGSLLLKGQKIILGTLITATGGGGTPAGNGGDGRIRAEYSKLISGSTTPTISSFQDKIFNTPQGGAGLLMQL